MYDDENLYVGIYAYDSEPDRIVATVQETQESSARVTPIACRSAFTTA